MLPPCALRAWSGQYPTKTRALALAKFSAQTVGFLRHLLVLNVSEFGVPGSSSAPDPANESQESRRIGSERELFGACQLFYGPLDAEREPLVPAPLCHEHGERPASPRVTRTRPRVVLPDSYGHIACDTAIECLVGALREVDGPGTAGHGRDRLP